MNTPEPNMKSHQLIAVLAASAAALVAFAASPFAHEVPPAALGIVAFILVQLLWPHCRLNFATPLCPGNIAQLLFLFQLVLLPLLIGYYGFSLGTLPELPSSQSVTTVIALRVSAYLAFCGAYQYFLGRAAKRAPVNLHGRAPAHRAGVSPVLVWTFAGLGLLGFVLVYGSFGAYLAYISSPVTHQERQGMATTLRGAASVFLRPFLGFSLVLAWSMWISRMASGHRPAGLATGRHKRLVLCGGVTLALVLVLLFVNFNYNRGIMLAPILAVSAAYSLHLQRLSWKFLALAAVPVLLAAITFGWYRSTDLDLADLVGPDTRASSGDQEVVDFLQVYAQGPQFSAYLIEKVGPQPPLYYGQTLISSLLYPLPILGKPFRETSGVVVYNRLIYGDSGILDQIIPYEAELYINWHIPGVISGFAFLGWLLSWFQRRFLRAETPVESYCWLVLALWTVFPGSLPVVSQQYIYFFWPIYIYLLVSAWRRRTRPVTWAHPAGDWLAARLRPAPVVPSAEAPR
jgi:hypothetical protein